MAQIDDFFMYENRVEGITDADYQRAQPYVEAAQAFAQTTYQSIYIIDYYRKIDFFEAYRIYSKRWSLEVVFKESKGNLGLRNFSSQIAITAITAMQYNLLSTARRFSDYETVGGLFKDATMSSVELTLTERIWDMILEIVREIAECFNIEDEDIFDTIAVGTGTWGIAAVIPKYLSLRLPKILQS